MPKIRISEIAVKEGRREIDIAKINEVDDQRFYMIPKSLFNNDKYKGLSLEAKVVYALLRDRMELSKKNNWVDENGDIYLLFTRLELAEMIDCSEPYIIKCMKQLIKYGLIEEKRQGLGKPNIIYVCHVVQSLENSQNLTPLSSGTKQDLVQDLNAVKSNDTDNNDTEKNDTEKYNIYTHWNNACMHDNDFPHSSNAETNKIDNTVSANAKRTALKENRHNAINTKSARQIEEFFEDVWKLYPRKKGKDDVSFRQKKKLFKIGFDHVKRAIERYKKEIDEEGRDMQYIQYGSTFFNGGYVDYLDENYETSQAASAKSRVRPFVPKEIYL